jgi:hypothetical protein
MDKQDYLTGIGELYAAEVLGEGLANRWMQLTTDPVQMYKLGLFLKLESEAKVRLRPLLARHGISLVERYCGFALNRNVSLSIGIKATASPP